MPLVVRSLPHLCDCTRATDKHGVLLPPLDPNEPNSFWALGRWFGMGLQRLVHQVVVIVLAILVVLVVALFASEDNASDVASVVGIVSGVLLFFGGATAGTVAGQLWRPTLALCILALGYVLFTALSQNEVVGGFAGVFLGLWLLTLIEFALRGSGRAGLTGERDVEQRFEEPGDEQNNRYSWPKSVRLTAALICAYAGLTLAVLAIVLTLAY